MGKIDEICAKVAYARCTAVVYKLDFVHVAKVARKLHYTVKIARSRENVKSALRKIAISGGFYSQFTAWHERVNTLQALASLLAQHVSSRVVEHTLSEACRRLALQRLVTRQLSNSSTCKHS